MMVRIWNEGRNEGGLLKRGVWLDRWEWYWKSGCCEGDEDCL